MTFCIKMSITSENIVELMLASEDHWDCVAAYIERVLKKKKEKREEIYCSLNSQGVQKITW